MSGDVVGFPEERVFVVRRRNGVESFALYAKGMLGDAERKQRVGIDEKRREAMQTVIFEWPLAGVWARATFDECIAEYRRHKAAGTLASLTPPPAEKKKDGAKPSTKPIFWMILAARSARRAGNREKLKLMRYATNRLCTRICTLPEHR